MTDHPTLLVTATVAEMMPLVRRLGLTAEGSARPRVWRGRFGEHSVAALTTGIGRAHAVSAMDGVLDRLHPRGVLITGTAGATNPALRTADVLTPAMVQDGSTGNPLRPTLPMDAAGTLRSMDAILGGIAAKQQLYERERIDAVDMETAAIAGVCDQRGLPWLCVRGILDDAHTALPDDLAALTTPDGDTHLGAALRYLLRHPTRLTLLMRLGRDTHRAMDAAADRLLTLL